MLICDIESTGLNPYRHGIISIGAVNFDHPDEYFYGEGRPHQDVEITDGALRVNGYTREQLLLLKDPISTTIINFLQWANNQPDNRGDWLIMGGHNIGFDMYFIMEEIERNNIPKELFTFKHRTIDLHTIAQTHYIQKQGFQYPKDMPADFIQRKLGLPVEPSPHHALNGACYEAECISRLWFNKGLFTDFEHTPVKDNPWK